MAQISCYDNDIQHVLMRSVISSENLSLKDTETRLVQYSPSRLVDTAAISPSMMVLKQFRSPIVMLSMLSSLAAPNARADGLLNSGGN